MRRLLIISLATILVISLAGCGSKTPPPNQAVKGFMDAMRKTDYLAAGKFVDSKESLDELLTFSEDEEEGKAVVDALMAQVTYKLGSEAITGENATVDVSITAPDMAHVAGAVMAEVMPAAFALAFSGAEDSEKQISVLFMNSFVTNVKDPQVPKVTSDITVKLIKTNDAWFIVPDDAFTNALTGNLQDAWAELDQGDN